MAPGPIFHNLSVPIWLGNALFLQGIACPTFGSNGALWSLSYEFWYYVLFPLGLSCCLTQTNIRTRILSAVLAVIIIFVVGRKIDMYFLIWMLGVGVGIVRSEWIQPLYANKIVRAGAWISSCLLVIIFLVICRNGSNHLGIITDIGLGIGVSTTMVLFLHFAKGLPATLYTIAARKLSAISYTLYLVHTPFLAFLCVWLIGSGRRWQPDTAHLVLGTGIVLITLVYTVAVWWIAESNTPLVRKSIERIRWSTNKPAIENN